MNLIIKEGKAEKEGKINKKNPSICLNMIVKNEANVILTTFDNLLKYIDFDYWVISDTGSTDNTQEIIQDYFFAKGIPGELVTHEWKDFGYNRTKALESAYGKTDYLLIFDADDKIEGNFKLPFVDKADGNYPDRYMLKIGQGFEYMRPLLINNRKRWQFKGVLHEFLDHLEPVNVEGVVGGDYHVVSGRSGHRSQNPTKYYDDAIILKNAYATELLLPDKGLSGRYAFYCARSYTDAGEKYFPDAIEWYKKVINIPNHWHQEKYYAALEIGKMYKQQNKNEEAVKYWLKTIEYDAERIEGVVQAVEYLYQSEQHVLVNALYHKFKDYKRDLSNKLFINKYMYNQKLEFFNAISAFYINDKYAGYQCCKEILLKQTLGENELNITMNNLLFYREVFEVDDTLPLFYAIDNLIARYNQLANNKNVIELWNIFFNKNRPALTKYNNKVVMKIKDVVRATIAGIDQGKAPQIFISFTTCKRYDLFQATMNSLLNHWKDVDQINYWFCVDDNSDEADRKDMALKYSWFDYYMKTPEEKGHRKSMNIIWEKLKQLQPTYWIHMEDDFLFYYPMNYVGQAIKALTTLSISTGADLRIKQILFNRNYAETVQDYNTGGHLPTPLTDIVLHNHTNEKITHYRNSQYWPHYSFRPSMTEVKTILELGNYNSPNQFFERDYADKWNQANYKSAFFNRITNRHIGRLTTEINDETIKNAYQLNSEEQFKAPKAVPCKIKIINLERRTDRRQNMQNLYEKNQITPYEFVKAVDGNELQPTLDIKTLFEGNDFGSRRGVIGCALTHYDLWKQLVNDTANEYYIIFEDDITFAENIKERLAELAQNELEQSEMLFLGYHMYETKRKEVQHIYDVCSAAATSLTAPLNKDLYIGGFFAYSINKTGAQKMVDYIKVNGIKHGIDYLVKIMPELLVKELQPHIVFSEWCEAGKIIDTDIQTNYNALDCTSIMEDQFIFLPQVDQIGHDMFHQRSSVADCMSKALKFTESECIGFNTLGFFKNKIETLTTSPYFGEKDGLYVKKAYYEMYKQRDIIQQSANIHIQKTLRIKLLCNWCSSETLCKEWANMCLEGYKWKNIQITWEDHAIDYYVIINYPLQRTLPESASLAYVPERTILFQMEPYVKDPTKDWGVKTWGEWADPATQQNKFLKIFTHKTHLNNVQWQIDYPFHSQPIKETDDKTKYDRVATICSLKNYDEGHILRNKFIAFVDAAKFSINKTKILDIFGKQNYHNFMGYNGPVPCDENKDDENKYNENKYNVYAKYKYCLTAENNWEHNYATEKIWEAILCETLCFYWGCPNLEEYIDPRAFVRLPLNKPAEALKIIRQAIAEDWWSQRIAVIKEMKEKILNQLGFFPLLASILT
jgi:GR25 family glycosyltransferase involved in LPS biosynthesis